MKVLTGLVLVVGFAFLAFLLVRSDPTAHQSDPGPVVPPPNMYDPVAAGESTPQGFRQLLRRDAIFPVYNPTFVAPKDVDWDDDTLVIGVELGGEAKAYPVSFLNRREMVIDWIGGSPVLVTW